MRPRYADLFKALLDEDPRRSDTAYDAVLFDRGEALPDLQELLRTSPDPRLRFYAVQLMGFSGENRAAAMVVEALSDTDPSVRAEACRSLEDLRARAPDILDSLGKRTRDLDPHVRRAAREAIAVLTRRSHE